MDKVTQATEENAEVLETQKVPDGISVGKISRNTNSQWETPEDEAEEVEEIEPEKEPETVEIEEVEEPDFIETSITDPGEFTPGDYSFEVTLPDGKILKINTPEEADEFADNDENFETAKQLKDFLSKAQKMEIRLDRDKTDYDDKKSKWDAQQTTNTERAAVVDNVAKGIDYLVSKGFIPAASDELKEKNWSDPEVAKQPGVKEQTELINYMVKENDVRIKAGLPPMTSIIDAYNAQQLDLSKTQAADEAKKAGQARKAAGARIAGTTPAPVSDVPRGIAVGRVNAFKNPADMWSI